MLQLNNLTVKTAVANRSDTTMNGKKIMLTLMLCSIFGITTAQNLVSNIRTEQRGARLHITYDLEERADIQVFVSFDGGVTYRSRPSRHVSGAVGEGVNPGKDKVLIWNMVGEFGYIDFSNVAIRVVANAPVETIVETVVETVVSTESIVDADISIDKPELSRFYVGITAGFGDYYIVDRDNIGGRTLGLNTAYFFNHHLGVGLTVQHYGRTFRNSNDFLGCTFLGPVFYVNLGALNGNIIHFPLRLGLGTYFYDIDISHPRPKKSARGISAGYFASAGIAFRPIDRISFGFNLVFSGDLNFGSIFDIDNHLVSVRHPLIGTNLGISFHF